MELFCCLDLLCRIDFWTLILTGINTISVIVIAVIQIKMQKQQNKIMKYNDNKLLYVKIQDIHNYASSIFMDVNRTLYHFKYNEEYFNRQSIELMELLRWLQKNQLDLSNKVGMTEKEYNSYYALLNTLHSLSYTIDKGIRNKQIITPDTEYNFTSSTDDNFINSILDCCIEKDTKNSVKKLLLEVKEYKNNLGNRLLNKLQKLCTL